jgi:transcriptional regulator GlxA family with amidase domain
MQKWRLKYLATWRLDLAADYLRAGEMTIRQIAETTGYGSESALTRAFKVQHRITPAKFRTLSTTVHPKN